MVQVISSPLPDVLPSSNTATTKSKAVGTVMPKYVYAFSTGKADGTSSMKSLLGGKGCGLAIMSTLGLPVPPGFTITTQVCTHFNTCSSSYPTGLQTQMLSALSNIEKVTNRTFGYCEKPLLLSVRSGAAVSMPGMMDTVLNLGLNDETVQALLKETGDSRFAYDSYRRFIQMFGNVVMGIDISKFEDVLNDYKVKYSVIRDTDLTADHLKNLIEDYKVVYTKETNGLHFTQDSNEQLWLAITAVFKSWKNQRAETYRKINGISDSLGTAVTVQAMVFGNLGSTSATGVAFTRDPSTGQNMFYGEYLPNAQGEDVVAGSRTPFPISEMKVRMPHMYKELERTRCILENYFQDVQDIEFTIERGVLYLLQTRNAKRSAHAAVKIAVDLVNEGIITKENAVLSVEAESLKQLLHRCIDPKSEKTLIANGLPASPGAACGKIVLSATKAEEMANEGMSVILCTEETSPDDVNGMHVSAGILTRRGGMTSHAAVVARGMGTPAVTGAGMLQVDTEKGKVKTGDLELSEGDVITIDGGVGEVYLGTVKTVEPELCQEFDTLMQWADEFKRMDILANAETPSDVERARKFGATGVGLCRTEHMFFEAERIVWMREMILANDKKGRLVALQKLLPVQQSDFEKIFEVMTGYPVTIRLLDPPLHEFLPENQADLEDVAKSAGVDVEDVKKRANGLHESNPMLGLRGCRVGILYPEVYDMQTKAILQAACAVSNRISSMVHVEIMVPFISTENEIEIMRRRIDSIASEIFSASPNVQVDYKVGTMIELPRAALLANRIAKHAEFFSFGTNDLTQTAYGLSRDDAGTFLNNYISDGVIETDPFVKIDEEGVGELIEIAVQRGKRTRNDLKTCLCGEQGGDSDSVAFCHRVGLDSVSCSPFSVPVARLAAAQASLKFK